MNSLLKFLTPSILLCASSIVPALASVARLQAIHENHGNRCTWLQDTRNPGTQRVRMISYVFMFGAGWKAALTVSPNDTATPLKKISYEVSYTSQANRHVAPSVVIETRDAQNKPVFTRFDVGDMDRRAAPGNRQLVTLDLISKFGHPVKVHKIAIGGNEQVITGNCYVMDCSICNFKAIDANDKQLSNTINLDVKTVARDSEAILLPNQDLGTHPRPNMDQNIASRL